MRKRKRMVYVSEPMQVLLVDVLDLRIEEMVQTKDLMIEDRSSINDIDVFLETMAKADEDQCALEHFREVIKHVGS